jgi:hypothetical protein
MTFLALSSSTRAELLVVKKTSEGFVPLSLEDDKAASPKIAAILLKYQWPMCIASNLTKEEQDELLTPGKPYAEELFIQKKIREAMGSDDYCVVFVPTALYELLCMYEFLKAKEDTPFWKAAIVTGVFESVEMLTYRKFVNSGDDIKKIIAGESSAYKIRKQIAEVFSDNNKLFFTENNVSFYINCAIGKYFLENYPKFKKSEDSFSFSKKLQGSIEGLIGTLLSDLKVINFKVFEERILLSMKRLEEHQKRFFPNSSFLQVIGRLLASFPFRDSIIFKIVDLEYEARLSNKALLMRGTSFKEFQLGLGEEKLLIGGTLFAGPLLERSYGRPYSISFGNSLFAGAFSDETACVYNHLYIRDFRNIRGYVVFIDKNAYKEHQNNNLFFIPSLATLPALFSKGEYFHARAKAAIANKKSPFSTTGIAGGGEVDPTGVLVITRDPLYHAELFSKYLAENSRLIKIGTDSLSKEEKAFVRDAAVSQKEAAQFYKSVKKLKDLVREKKERASRSQMQMVKRYWERLIAILHGLF